MIDRIFQAWSFYMKFIERAFNDLCLRSPSKDFEFKTELFLFRKYCLAACEVEEPELKFNIDQYTDLTLITKPVIYISVQEIVDTHQVINRKLGHCDLSTSWPVHRPNSDN